MSKKSITRRRFVQNVSTIAAAGVITGQSALAGSGLVASHRTHAGSIASAVATDFPRKPIFKISLGHWSYHRSIFGDSRKDNAWFNKMLDTDPDAVLLGEMDPRDVVVRAREHGIEGVDYANQLFFGHARDIPWLTDLKSRADSEGVKSLVILCDRLGKLGDADRAKRVESVEKHKAWLEAAAYLGCHSIRVNAFADGTYLEQLHRVSEGLTLLCEEGEKMGIDVLVENHRQSSSNGAWLAMVIQNVEHPRIGAVTDFGNFDMSSYPDDPRWYDRYQGLMDLAPYTRVVSAKAHGFNEKGEAVDTDFAKAMRIILDAGFRGYAELEYEGDSLSENDGVAATVKLLRKVQAELTEEYGSE